MRTRRKKSCAWGEVIAELKQQIAEEDKNICRKKKLEAEIPEKEAAVEKLQGELQKTGERIASLLAEKQEKEKQAQELAQKLHYRDLDAAKEEDKLYITVTDDGVGMTKERLLHIFNRRNHLNGHGYGVWNIHERIKLNLRCAVRAAI